MIINRMIKAVLLSSLVGASILTGCSKKSAAPPSSGGQAAGPAATPVDVTTVKTGNIKKHVPVVGSLNTLFNISLSPRTAGRLITVNVREGDFVHKGQVLAQIDPTLAGSEVQQDQANVVNDEAKVAQAQVQYTQGIVNANVAVEQAQAQLASAQSTLDKTTVGDQPQQKLQAKDDLVQQQANFDNALSNYQQQQQLFSEGAIARSDLNNAITTYQTQKALLDNYKQALSLSEQGGRPEDISAAKEVVNEDKEALKNAVANLANIRVDKEAITAAQAQVQLAKGQVASAEQDLADTNLVSPINGYVSQRSADPGSLASPGTAVLEVVDLSTVYYEPTVSEQDLVGIHTGDAVSVQVDAIPGTTFHGVVASVFPSASSTNRQFSLRVDIPNVGGALRPGMYARGSIVTSTAKNVIVVPLTALVPQTQASGFSTEETSTGIATGTTVLPPEMAFVLGPNNTATTQNVVVGIVNGTRAQIISGLNVGDKIVVKGQNQINSGDKVQPTVVTFKEAVTDDDQD
jgi:RND family efflux transporter MFP subunit